VRQSPFYDATRAAGATAFTVYNHMYMPTSYGDTEAEYWALVQGVTLWDVSAERQIEISGPDAEAFTQLLTPRDIASCPVGRGRYVIFLDDDAGIVNDAVLLRLAPDKFWLSPGDGDVLLWAKAVATQVDMDVQVHEPDVSPLQLQGPLAGKVAQKLFGDIAIEMGYYHFHELEIAGIPVVLSRTGWSGEFGYEIFLRDGSRGTELWDLCMAAGAEFDIKPACPSLVRSVEGALLSYYSDIAPTDNPFTIGMAHLLDIGKPHPYIGKAALQKIAETGPTRRLVGANFEGDRVAGNPKFWDIQVNGEKVGHITRCCYSPRLGHNIALVNLPVALAEPGTKISLDIAGEWRDATVCALPWFDSIKKLPENP